MSSHKQRKAGRRPVEERHQLPGVELVPGLGFELIPGSILQYHRPSGFYWHPGLQAWTDENGMYVTDEHGQPLKTPRTDSVDHTGQTDLGLDYDHDDTTAGYTHNAHQAAADYPPDLGEKELADGVQGLDIEDREDAERFRDLQDAQSVVGSLKGKAVEKSSKRDEKKVSSSSKHKKDGKSSGEKKVKGKGKEKEETRYQNEAPDEPFYEVNTSQHQQAQQAQSQTAPRQKRAHRHKTAPTGGTGGAIHDDPQPVDAGYGAKSARFMDSEVPYYPNAEQSPEVGYHGGQGLQDQIEVPDEFGNVAIPTDAGFASGLPLHQDEDEDPAFQAAAAASREAALGRSVDYDAFSPGYAPAESSSQAQDDADYELAEDDEGDGNRTPTQGSHGLDFISGTGGSHEIIDSRYRVEPSSKFLPGEVFKVLWSEPQGQSRDNRLNNAYTERVDFRTEWGERFYVTFRRFVIIANDEGHCQCVPILTYIRQGCKKKGVKPAKHGIVHEYNSKPRLIEGEPRLGFKPVRMQLKVAGERLARESRINYSKLVTVEHNVKVFFIGSIDYDDFCNVIPAAVDKCWQEKLRHMAKKGDHGNPRT